MATYVNNLRLTELATGEGSGTWGTTTNTSLELIGEALGYNTQDCFSSDADATTTVADGATDPARSFYFKVTSSATLSATRTLTIAPNTVSRVMFIENATTGSQSIAISQGSGANVTIATGKTAVVYLDGAGSGAAVVDAMANVDPGVTDTLAETLAAGNTTGGTDIAVGTGDDITFADNSKTIFGAGSDVSIYSDGTDGLITSTGNLTLDVAGDIILDADSGAWRFKDGGGSIVEISVGSGSSPTFYSPVSDADIVFKGNDGGSTITALTLDMSAAGVATFNDAVRVPAGSVGSPTITNSADTNTGLYWPGADQVGFTVAGSRKFYVTSTQAFFQNLSSGVSISGGLAAEGGAVFNDGSADVDFRVESNNQTHALFVDAGNDTVNINRSSGPASLNVQADSGADGIAIYGRSSDEISQITNYNSTGTGLSQLQTRTQYTELKTLTDVPLYFSPNNALKFTVSTAATIVNENSVDHDFRVESNAATHMLFVDAGNDRVGINESAPDSPLHVKRSAVSNSWSPYAGTTLTLEENSGNGNILQFMSDNAATGEVWFGDDDSRNVGRIRYEHNNNKLELWTDGTERFSIDSSGAATFSSSITTTDVNITSNTPVIRFTESDQSDKQYQLGSFGSAFAIYDSNNSQYRYVLDTNGNHVFNEGSTDSDFRVESDGNTHMLFVDAGNDAVGIGTSSAGSFTIGDLVVGDGVGARGITIFAATDNESILRFADGTSGDQQYRGQIKYNHAEDSLNFHANGASGSAENLILKTSEAVFNEGGIDTDFRVESNSNANALVVDAGNSTVGINTSAGNNGLTVTGGGTMTGNWNKSLMITANFPVLTWNSVAGSGGYSGIGYDASSSNHSWNFWHRGTSEDLSGTAQIAFSIKSGEIVVNESSNDTDFRVESDSNTHALFVDAGNSRVGINEDNPGAHLHVLGNNDSDGATIKLQEANNNTSDTLGTIFFGNNADDTLSHILGYTNTNNTTSYVRINSTSTGTVVKNVDFGPTEVKFNDNGADVDFRVESDANANALFMDASTSYVGINRSPSVELDVQRISTSYPFRISATDGSARAMVFADSAGSPSRVNWLAGAQYNTDNGWELTPSTANGGYTFTNRVLTAYANGDLTVNENGISADFRVESDGNANMIFVDAGNNRVLIGTNTGSAVSSTCNTMHVAGGSSDAVTPVMMISDADGSVEGNSTILECLFSGDNTFSEALYVKFTDSGGTQGSISGTGDGTVTYNTSSDERLKQSIQDTDSKWDLVKSLQVRDYEWKKSGKKEIGFIAQELHEKWAQPVKVGGEDVEVDPWSVDYGKLTPILTKALQEAMEKIEALEAKITALEAN